MAALQIEFEGVFQCRLAAGENYLEKRGTPRGWTFAAPGEPDLDRIIRFNNPISPRSRARPVGVRVQAVKVAGEAQPGHPLAGGQVDLLGAAKFEGRDGEISSDAKEPILPFNILFVGGGLRVGRDDVVDINDPVALKSRRPSRFVSNSPEARRAIGAENPAAFRQARRQLLLQDVATAGSPQQKAALMKRIAELAIPGTLRESALGFQLFYRFPLRHTVTLDDPGATLPANVLLDAPWQIDFWMGGWDADALTGYVSGVLTIPLR